jgi:hypothetical protein
MKFWEVGSGDFVEKLATVARVDRDHAHVLAFFESVEPDTQISISVSPDGGDVFFTNNCPLTPLLLWLNLC